MVGRGSCRFCGSGSQISVGEANGRRVFSMKISPAYVGVAAERWQAETGKDAILDGDGWTFAQVKKERLGGRELQVPSCARRSFNSRLFSAFPSRPEHRSRRRRRCAR